MKKTFLELLAAGAVAVVFLTVVFAMAATIKPNQPPSIVTPIPATTASPTAAPLTSQEFKTFKTWEDAKLFLAAANQANRYAREYEAVPAGAPMTKAADTSTSASSDYSTTNVQVAGVDEDDTLKNDGKFLYTVSNGQIFIVDAYPAEQAHVVTVLNDSNSQYQSIFVTGNRLVAFGSRTFKWKPWIEPWVKQELADTAPTEPNVPPGAAAKIAIAPDYYPYYPEQSQFMKIFDISDRAKPVLLKTIDSKGNLVAARLIGNRVYAVFNEYATHNVPRPLYAVDGKLAEMSPVDVKYVDYPFDNYQFTTVLGQDVDNTNNPESRTVVLTGGASTVYVSANNAYVAYTRYQTYYPLWDAYKAALEGKWTAEYQAKFAAIDSSDASDWLKDRMKIALAQQFLQTLDEKQSQELYAEISKRQDALQQSQTTPRENTEIHKFSLGSTITYAGRGQAPGHLLNQFSMDESDGYLRLATTVGEVWGAWRPMVRCMPDSRCVQPTPEPSKNNVYVLDSSLKLVGKLEDLAPGEKIYSSRFMGKRAYLVTFKKVDPLFVIGLEEPTNPTLLGKLKIPGYSDYLHPYDETHLIGLGKDAVPAEDGDFAWYQGVKLSLFDVSDVASPKEIATYSIGDRGTESYALHDHKAFLFSRERNLLVIPINLAVINKEKYPQGVTPQTYGDHVFQGAYVFTASLDGFALRGTVSHAEPEIVAKSGEYYYGYGTEVTRSAYISDTLYTVSNAYVKANALSDLEAKASIKLPQPSKPDYPPYWEGDVIAMPVASK